MLYNLRNSRIAQCINNFLPKTSKWPWHRNLRSDSGFEQDKSTKWSATLERITKKNTIECVIWFQPRSSFTIWQIQAVNRAWRRYRTEKSHTGTNIRIFEGEYLKGNVPSMRIEGKGILIWLRHHELSSLVAKIAPVGVIFIENLNEWGTRWKEYTVNVICDKSSEPVYEKPSNLLEHNKKYREIGRTCLYAYRNIAGTSWYSHWWDGLTSLSNETKTKTQHRLRR